MRRLTRAGAMTGLGAGLVAACGLAAIAQPDARRRGVETSRVREPGAAPISAPFTPLKDNDPVRLLTPQEKRGLIFRMQSINASSSIGANPSCPCGYSVNRNLSLSGNVMDPSGARPFRVAEVHIDTVEDAFGNDLRTPGMFNTYPNATNTQQFTRPQGHQQSMSFSMNFSQLQSMPETIGRLAGHVDAELAGRIKTIDVDPEKFEEPVEVAPGMTFHLTRYGFQGTNLVLAFEYRIELDEQAAPAGKTVTPMFYGFEIRDTDGQAILDIQNASQTVTTDSIIGTASYNTGVGSREIASIRLRVATEVETVRFELDERNVPLMAAFAPAVAGAR